MNTQPISWPDANQRHVMASLALVRAALERQAARVAGSAEPDVNDAELREAVRVAAESMPAPAALDGLTVTFGMSPFERDVLLLCAGVELDATFAALCAAANGEPRHAFPTFGLAMAALPDAHWSTVSPDAPLRRWRMIEFDSSAGVMRAPLRIDERVLHYLTGVSCMDVRLRGIVERVAAQEELPASHAGVAARAAEVWTRSSSSKVVPVVQFCGADATAIRVIAVAACRTIGLRLHGVRASDIPSAAVEQDAVARLWEREAAFGESALLIEADDVEPSEIARTVLPFIERVHGVVLVNRREPLGPWGRSIVRLDVEQPTTDEQRSMWREVLGDAAQHVNGDVERVVQHFDMGSRGIRAAGMQAMPAIDAGTDDAGVVLWDACRSQARPRLDNLAQRIAAVATWDDLVLPASQRDMLREIVAHVRQRATVYERWGFANAGSRGLGISALFAGGSGTGKTLAAEVLAHALRLDLYRIDLSTVVSKYIGETEKNLRRVFDAAEEAGAILFFDEADALFGKRSEVKDSHDRYANIEVSYLLQRMESYRGLAILTTNLKNAIDTAFLRRLRFVVHFPFPDAAQRREIWRRMFPPAAPTSGVDEAKLARLNIAGGNIRNIALNAAFLAADAGEPVRMAHLLRAARGEYAKMEKTLTENEIAGWLS